ncbi:MAG: hypothetical protein PHW04_06590 [Candidatus Wallbacteria bacterium]|nr:hypothetical protein [Candidatus Wallbacteria bacterium]
MIKCSSCGTIQRDGLENCPACGAALPPEKVSDVSHDDAGNGVAEVATAKKKWSIQWTSLPVVAALLTGILPIAIFVIRLPNTPKVFYSTMGYIFYFSLVTAITCPLIGYLAGMVMEKRLRSGRDECTFLGGCAGMAAGFLTGTEVAPVLIDSLAKMVMGRIGSGTGDLYLSLLIGTGPGLLIGLILGRKAGTAIEKNYLVLEEKEEDKNSERMPPLNGDLKTVAYFAIPVLMTLFSLVFCLVFKQLSMICGGIEY